MLTALFASDAIKEFANNPAPRKTIEGFHYVKGPRKQGHCEPLA